MLLKAIPWHKGTSSPHPSPPPPALPVPEEVVVVISAGCVPVTLLLPEDAGGVDGTAVQNGSWHPRCKQRGICYGMGTSVWDRPSPIWLQFWGPLGEKEFPPREKYPVGSGDVICSHPNLPGQTWECWYPARGCPPGPKLTPCPPSLSHTDAPRRRCLFSSPPRTAWEAYNSVKPCTENISAALGQLRDKFQRAAMIF